MGPAALAVMAVGTVLQFAGQMQQAKAANQQGLNAAAMANYKAAQQEQAAGQEVAASQRAAQEEHRRATLMASRALAVSGASGGGVSDPTVMGLIGDIEGEGAYRGALDLYQGQDRARQLNQGAATSRTEGLAAYNDAKAKSSAMKTSAWGSLATNAAGAYMKADSLGMFEKYGGGGYTDFVKGYTPENYG